MPEPSNTLISNNHYDNFYNELCRSFDNCTRFYFNVAFVSYSGLQILLDLFKNSQEKNISGRIITSTYLNFTDPKALSKINTFENIDLRVYVAKRDKGFHPKGYIFEYPTHYKVIIGSANITQSALKSNIEWNVSIISKNKDTFFENIYREFESIWNDAEDATENFIAKYSNFLNELKPKIREDDDFYEKFKTIVPNSMQDDALSNLKRLRQHGETKALAIAATGSGKTYLAAFDVAKFSPKRMLFIVHREEILNSALKSFQRILNNPHVTFGLLTGSQKDLSCDYLFATNLSMRNHLEYFDPHHFDYVIIDEAHHVTSDSYKDILDYFKPDFLLGMTATPERGDSLSIYDTFDNNIAIEIRLRDALEEDLVVPFHYFGITEVEGLDFQKVDLNDLKQVSKLLQVHFRVDHIIKNMNFYGFEGEKQKAIGFCVTIEHAQYMSDEFNKRGIQSLCLSGEDNPTVRKSAISKLEDPLDPLTHIFTVDIFNEGVDIPSINTVLMLRPTSSPIIFIQQLGRGLRKHPEKTFLTVLDFIGNHSKAFLIAIALCGRKFYDKDSLKVAVQTDFANIPGCTHIRLDPISKEQILRQIETENFNSLKYLKSEYEDFKLLNRGQRPKLVDFQSIDGAPNPIRYIERSKTYLSFCCEVEKFDHNLKQLSEDDIFLKTLRFLNELLPLKRIHEFAILKYIIQHGTISLEQVHNEVLLYLNSVDEETLFHALLFLQKEFFDDTDKQKFGDLIQKSNQENQWQLAPSFATLLADPVKKEWILDSLQYGIYRFEKDFGAQNYGKPFLKLYHQYNMRDVALMSNYDKKHSAFRGQGLLTHGKDYFLFIELHKLEDAIAYKDKFISDCKFQWDSPNSSHQSKGQGKKVLEHKHLNIHLHLFVRKFKEIDGKVQPYIYIGEADVISAEHNNPITFQMELHHKVPAALYTEFTTVTR